MEIKDQTASVICLDVVGFSRHMGQDAPRTVRLFETRFTLAEQICNRNGGRIFGLAGDSFMIEFGRPSDALKCAREIQAEVAALNANDVATGGIAMEYRIGISAGLVYSDGDRLFGNEVNISSRLQELAPSGGICVSEAIHAQTFDKFDIAFEDLGERELKNIPGRVKVFKVLNGRGDDTAQTNAAPRRSNKPDMLGPTIAVLPIRAIRGAEDLEYMGEGLSSDLITGLSRNMWLSVISSSSSFLYGDATLPRTSIADSLNANYLVNGTISRQDETIQLRVELFERDNAVVLWSELFHSSFDNVMELQGRVSLQIAGRLVRELGRREETRAYENQIDSLETWQLVHRGNWHIARRSTKDTTIARELFEKAQQIAPHQTAALLALAWWHFWQAWLTHGRPSSQDSLKRAEDLALEAKVLDAGDARVHAYLGMIAIMRMQPTKAMGFLGSALRLNPSLSAAHSGRGSAWLQKGDPKLALPELRRAEALNPSDLNSWHNLGEMAAAYYFAGEFDSAIDAADRSLILAPGYWYARLVRMAARIDRGGKQDLHRADLDKRELIARDPKFTAKRIQMIPYEDRSYNGVLTEKFEIV